jgi:shikimate kinase
LQPESSAPPSAPAVAPAESNGRERGHASAAVPDSRLPTPDSRQFGHLILVGLPGVGKTAVGRAVAERLGRPFLDFDAEIERREGKSVSEIFTERGEAAFRALERALTEELRSMPGMVLAPGGGWVATEGNVALLRPPGRIIFLDATPETVLRRLGEGRHRRPLLVGTEPLPALRRLLADRGPAYRSADHVVDTEVVDFQELIHVVAELAPWGRGG